MAFIRKETKNSVTCLCLVESYRDADGKSRHRTLDQLYESQEQLKHMIYPDLIPKEAINKYL